MGAAYVESILWIQIMIYGLPLQMLWCVQYDILNDLHNNTMWYHPKQNLKNNTFFCNLILILFPVMVVFIYETFATLCWYVDKFNKTNYKLLSRAVLETLKQYSFIDKAIGPFPMKYKSHFIIRLIIYYSLTHHLPGNEATCSEHR